MDNFKVFFSSHSIRFLNVQYFAIWWWSESRSQSTGFTGSTQSVGTLKHILEMDLKHLTKLHGKIKWLLKQKCGGILWLSQSRITQKNLVPSLCSEIGESLNLERATPDKTHTHHSMPGLKGALNYLNMPRIPQTDWDTAKPWETIIWGINRGRLWAGPALGTHGRRWSRRCSHNPWAVSLTKCSSLHLMGHSEPLALVPAWLGRDRKMALLRNTHGNTAVDSQECSAPQNSTSPLCLGINLWRKSWNYAKSQV